MITTELLEPSRPLVIPYRVTAHDANCHVDFQCALTPHSDQRSKQRSVSRQAIVTALEFGECYQKQSLEFYFLGEKNLPAHLTHERAKYLNTVVVLRDGKYIVTVYRNKRSARNISKKPKCLF